MKKKIVKTVIKSVLFLLLSVTVIYYAVLPLKECVLAASSGSFESGTFTRDYLTVSADTFCRDYKEAKKVLSADENFEDLIFGEEMASLQYYSFTGETPNISYTPDNFNNRNLVRVDNYNVTENARYGSVYSKHMADDGYITLTDGRLIDDESPSNADEPLEVLVGSDSRVAVGDMLCVALPFYDSQQNQVSVTATVVGKITLDKYMPTMGDKTYEAVPMTGSYKLPSTNVLLIENPFDNHISEDVHYPTTHYKYAPVKFIIMTKEYTQQMSPQTLESAADKGSAFLGERVNSKNLFFDIITGMQFRRVLPVFLIAIIMYIAILTFFVRDMVSTWKRKK